MRTYDRPAPHILIVPPCAVRSGKADCVSSGGAGALVENNARPGRVWLAVEDNRLQQRPGNEAWRRRSGGQAATEFADAELEPPAHLVDE